MSNNRNAHALISSRQILGAILRPVVAVAVLFSFGWGAQAVADTLAGRFGPAYSTTFSAPRDPLQFIEQTRVVLPPPVVALNRKDAVAQELLSRAETLSEAQAMRTADVLCEEADRLGHDPLLFLAVIHIESFYNHLAISPVGAEGLMQIMPTTAEWFSKREGLTWPENHSFDPETNVRLGTRYLAHLDKRFRGRMDLALTAYNRGPSATRYLVRTHGKLPTEIRDFYATKVLERYRKLVRKYGHLARS